MVVDAPSALLKETYHGTLLQRLRRIPVRTAVSAAAKRTLSSGVPVWTRTFWGRRMKVYLPEEVSVHIYRYGVHEPDLCAALCDLLRPGDTFYDIGAHFGFFSLLAADLVGETGSVHAFEPTPSTFAVLAANVSSLPQASAACCAVWKEQSLLAFRDFGPVYCAYNTVGRAKTPKADAGRQYRVPAITIDDYVSRSGRPPSFVKIDVESAEYEVLQGMRATLERHRPLVSIEVGDITPGNRASRESITLVADSGYVPAQYMDGCVPHAVREVYGYDNILLVPEEKAPWMKTGATRATRTQRETAG